MTSEPFGLHTDLKNLGWNTCTLEESRYINYWTVIEHRDASKWITFLFPLHLLLFLLEKLLILVAFYRMWEWSQIPRETPTSFSVCHAGGNNIFGALNSSSLEQCWQDPVRELMCYSFQSIGIKRKLLGYTEHTLSRCPLFNSIVFNVMAHRVIIK